MSAPSLSQGSPCSGFLRGRCELGRPESFRLPFRSEFFRGNDSGNLTLGGHGNQSLAADGVDRESLVAESHNPLRTWAVADGALSSSLLFHFYHLLPIHRDFIFYKIRIVERRGG